MSHLFNKNLWVCVEIIFFRLKREVKFSPPQAHFLLIFLGEKKQKWTTLQCKIGKNLVQVVIEGELELVTLGNGSPVSPFVSITVKLLTNDPSLWWTRCRKAQLKGKTGAQDLVVPTSIKPTWGLELEWMWLVSDNIDAKVSESRL